MYINQLGKLELLKKRSNIQKIYYNSPTDNIKLLKQKLVIKQNHLMNNTSDYIVQQQEKWLRTQLDKNFIKQEQAQEARQAWFQLGDWNNKYYKTMATIRKHKNTIWKVKDGQGN